MGILRLSLEGVETILAAQGYTRAAENFHLNRQPRCVAHKSYTFGIGSIRPRYLAHNKADYLGTVVPLIIMWMVHGDHNTSGTQTEAYKDILDEFELLETAIVKNQLRDNDEEIVFGESVLDPWFSEDNQDILMLTIPLVFDATRSM